MCPLCECLPLASFPSTPVPNSTLQHCYTTYIMLISWSRGRSGQLQKWAFSLSKWVQHTHRAPHSPPECWISSKCQWFRYNIKYLAFRWGIGGFELDGELSETGRVGFSRGQPSPSIECVVSASVFEALVEVCEAQTACVCSFMCLVHWLGLRKHSEVGTSFHPAKQRYPTPIWSVYPRITLKNGRAPQPCVAFENRASVCNF